MTDPAQAFAVPWPAPVFPVGRQHVRRAMRLLEAEQDVLAQMIEHIEGNCSEDGCPVWARLIEDDKILRHQWDVFLISLKLLPEDFLG